MLNTIGILALSCGPVLALGPGLLAADDLASLIEEYGAPQAPVRTRMEVASEIAALGTPEAREFLAGIVLEAEPTILKRRIFDALRRELAPVPDELLEKAARDEDPYLRAHSLEVLAATDPEILLGLARQALRSDEDVRVRLIAIELLGRGAEGETARFLFMTCATLSPREQRLAIAVLGGLPGPVFAQVLGGEEPWWAERDIKDSLRLLGTLVLAGREGPAADSPLPRLAKDRDAQVAFAAALGIGRRASREGGTAMRLVLKRAPAVDAHCAILRLAKDCGLVSPGLTDVLIDELKHRDWRVRAAAAEALGATETDEAVAPLVELLQGEERHPVRIACIRALGSSRRRSAVPALIGLLDQMTGLPAREARVALSTMTGMDLGQRSASWRLWWEDHRDTFEPEPRAMIQWNDVAEPQATRAFYGIPVHSDRLVFVLDVSGSMQGNRLDRLKKELTTIIDRLPESSRFNMVFFAGSAHPWRNRLQPLTKRNREAAKAEVMGRTAGGGTNLWKGLLEAFDDEDVDTIYLLSDGAPTVGEVTGLATICRRIGELNQHRRVVIHVVVIGMESVRLRELALDSGGTYVRHVPDRR